MCVCVCVFNKLHITTQSGPVILVVCVCVCVCYPHLPIGRQPYSVIYAIANPVVVRGLLDRKISEEHLQSLKERIKTKTTKGTGVKQNKTKKKKNARNDG